MTIEARIDALIAALNANTAALTGGKPAAAAPAATTDKPAAKPAAKPAQAEAPKLDYERDLKPLALRVAKEKSRDALAAINKTFGVDHAGKLKPEQWGDYIKACENELAPAQA